MPRGRILTSNPVNREHPVNRGLFFWGHGGSWLSGGGTLWDIAGARHGTFGGAPTWAQSRPPNGLSGLTLGTGNYVSTPNAQPSLLTVSCWARSTDGSDAGIMVGTPRTTNTVILSLGLAFGTLPGLAYYDASIPGWAISGIGSGSSAHGDGKWHHWVGTFDGSSLNCYYDGGLVGSAGTPFTTLTNLTGTFDLGRYSNDSAYFAGDITDMRLQDQPLSAAEVQTLYRESLADYPNLLRRHRPRVILFGPTGAPSPTPGVASFVSSGPGGISVSATEATGGTGPYTHQWQRNTDGGSYSNLTGATALTLDDTTAVSGHLYGYKLVYTDTLSATATSNAVTAEVYSGGALGGGGGTGTVFLTTAGGSVALMT